MVCLGFEPGAQTKPRSFGGRPSSCIFLCSFCPSGGQLSIDLSYRLADRKSYRGEDEADEAEVQVAHGRRRIQ